MYLTAQAVEQRESMSAIQMGYWKLHYLPSQNPQSLCEPEK